MTIDESTRPAEALTNEDYSKAMNFIGQNLLTSLVQSVEKLPPHLRSNNVISQALSAFIANIIYKQSPGNPESCQQMLDAITKLVKMQLENLPQLAK
ncbi:hypothetical protein OQJ19_04945 [Fluoribacter gormanii]|uniref:Uncharacterized protein n=1 Tax=Fluoribacter gormanii TaxID=464 RepID=A0A377GGY6_9GAMM|nr:hypothetical protein [Fluoribacter gormanii]KTD02454.1 hypothetical protein Lgor_1746 [Fluoribacter gormanii]MCW8444793.1 hypothetical protein [Fluoribacter gormanii]MCW8470004.1 hypothetical protein [Fluoribacter gormanii]SIR69178.1 hypothetical protein SAMN05421777_11955 [Fluoribacter gormanii]STO23642.1 Uncharacterised protein [Fluoribacter gormanii]